MEWSTRSNPHPILRQADTYIKQEIDVKDEPDFDPGSQMLVDSKSNTHAGLSDSVSSVHYSQQSKIAEARLSKQRRANPQAAGMIQSRDQATFVRVTHILLDTGASCSSVSLELVRTAGLQMHAVKPVRTHTGNGYVWRDKVVYVDLWLAGIRQQIIAYVDESSVPHTFILGTTDRWLWGMDINECEGRHEQRRVTVFRRETGYRRKKFVLAQAPEGYKCKLGVYEFYKGLAMAQDPGETISESNSRGVIERASARYKTAVKKHGQRIKKELRDNY